MQAPLTKYYSQNKKKTNFHVNKNKEADVHKGPMSKEEAAEEQLITFDFDARFGPCKGITRTERFDLANKFHLNPSKDVKVIIDDYKLDKSYYDRYM